MASMRTSGVRLCGIGILIALLATACAHDPRDAFSQQIDAAAAEKAPLGGEALFQRKLELRRAFDDMTSFRRTLESMNDRGDSHSVNLFRPFLNTYMATHLDTLLRPEWQSQHPELIGVDANLRFIEAEVLIQMGYSGWVNDVIDELVRRYDGRGNMLVDYPIGTQTTLREALALLKDRRWRAS